MNTVKSSAVRIQLPLSPSRLRSRKRNNSFKTSNGNNSSSNYSQDLKCSKLWSIPLLRCSNFKVGILLLLEPVRIHDKCNNTKLNYDKGQEPWELFLVHIICCLFDLIRFKILSSPFLFFFLLRWRLDFAHGFISRSCQRFGPHFQCSVYRVTRGRCRHVQ